MDPRECDEDLKVLRLIIWATVSAYAGSLLAAGLAGFALGALLW